MRIYLASNAEENRIADSGNRVCECPVLRALRRQWNMLCRFAVVAKDKFAQLLSS